MGISVREQRQLWFRRLDRAFWVIWAALPVVLWLAYQRTITASATIAESLTGEQAKCAAIVANPLAMSAKGQVLFWSLFAGKKAGDNPWGEGATTLEWTLSSPPPTHQFNELPVVKGDEH